jgi:hypothetical protein
MSHYENLFSSQQFGLRPHHSTTDHYRFTSCYRAILNYFIGYKVRSCTFFGFKYINALFYHPPPLQVKWSFPYEGIVWKTFELERNRSKTILASVFFLKKNILIPRVTEKNILILVEKKKIIWFRVFVI